ncbi:MAG: DbpA RNA binding domain-containing protein [Flavobacteriales bacterium]|nr:DbpA RNA binding domain-containing protein [Flavobacteriales bacterium]
MFINIGTRTASTKAKMLATSAALRVLPAQHIGRILLKDMFSFMDIDAAHFDEAMGRFKRPTTRAAKCAWTKATEMVPPVRATSKRTKRTFNKSRRSVGWSCIMEHSWVHSGKDKGNHRSSISSSRCTHPSFMVKTIRRPYLHCCFDQRRRWRNAAPSGTIRFGRIPLATPTSMRMSATPPPALGDNGSTDIQTDLGVGPHSVIFYGMSNDTISSGSYRTTGSSVKRCRRHSRDWSCIFGRELSHSACPVFNNPCVHTGPKFGNGLFIAGRHSHGQYTSRGHRSWRESLVV